MIQSTRLSLQLIPMKYSEFQKCQFKVLKSKFIIFFIFIPSW